MCDCRQATLGLAAAGIDTIDDAADRVGHIHTVADHFDAVGPGKAPVWAEQRLVLEPGLDAAGTGRYSQIVPAVESAIR